MRTFWIVVIPVVLMSGMPAQAQSNTRKKANNSRGNWAVQQVQYAEMQPLPTGQAPGLMAPGPVQMAPPAPIHGGGAPIVIHPPMPVAPAHQPPPAGSHGCGCADGNCKGKHDWLSWLCYRPRRAHEKIPCGPCCRVPLFYYMGGCKEGYHFDAKEPCCPCPRPDMWSKAYQTGHSMFAMPTGHGCCVQP